MSTSSSPPLTPPPPPEIIPVQPDHFYGQSAPISPDSRKEFLDPAKDPFATRGIPVFTPTLEEFQDFEKYVTRIEPWGMTSGIVKIIPPKEWTARLPSTVKQLGNVRMRNPIEQEMVGRAGLFRQQNVEKRRVMSVREWAELCAKDDFRAPTRDEVQTGRRTASATGLRSSRFKRPHDDGPIDSKPADEIPEDDKDDGHKLDHGDDPSVYGSINIKPDCTPTPEVRDAPSIDPASTLPSPPHTTASPAATSSPSPSKDKAKPKERTRDKAAAEAARRVADAAFLETFDPHTAWLPQDTTSQDYTPELCRALERAYWRNCGLGRAPWYGADMKGSLFTEATTAWNVASLPSSLSRLLRGDPISGVNTPYLYFGMWRATFAWHVEDMDLFSINYIHFGAPKHWYAVPQGRAQALETTMRGYFPGDSSQCPQFLRHKSFLASPTLLAQSSVRPNVLVQHAGEFVITFPRGYHAGFNLGFNCAESVNFALESWVELGLRASWCTCEIDSVRIDVKGLLEARNRASPDPPPHPAKPPPPKRKREIDPSGNPPPPKRPKPSSVSSVPNLASKPVKSKPVPEPETPFTCCLCVSSKTDDLLRVHDPPGPGAVVGPPPADGVWRAHASCARVIPETWVDGGSGAPGEEALIWGVDSIVRDRWTLKCAACTRPRSKLHGAPIQCSKGKCSKAFHVSCASAGAQGTSYRELEELEKEVVLIDPVPVAPADAQSANHSMPAGDSVIPPPLPPAPRVLKTIKKLSVELLCSQHNPTLIALKKSNKDSRVRAALAALEPMSRIRIRNSSGVFEVSLVRVWEERGTVEVLWDGGIRREFRWGSVVWGTGKDQERGGRREEAQEGKTMNVVDNNSSREPTKPTSVHPQQQRDQQHQPKPHSSHSHDDHHKVDDMQPKSAHPTYGPQDSKHTSQPQLPHRSSVGQVHASPQQYMYAGNISSSTSAPYQAYYQYYGHPGPGPGQGQYGYLGQYTAQQLGQLAVQQAGQYTSYYQQQRPFLPLAPRPAHTAIPTPSSVRAPSAPSSTSSASTPPTTEAPLMASLQHPTSG